MGKRKHKFAIAGFTIAEGIAVGTILGVVSLAFLTIQKEHAKNKLMSKYYDIINETMNTVENPS